MKTDNYFDKYGVIYGITRELKNGATDYRVTVFLDLESAKRWVSECVYGYSKRYLVSHARAKRLTGENAIDDAYFALIDREKEV